MNESAAVYTIHPDAVSNALALCERAESEMAELERCLFGYRACIARLVLCIRERQRADRLGRDNEYPSDVATRRGRERIAIEKAHLHDELSIKALTKAGYHE